jgi:hypothetical protein
MSDMHSWVEVSHVAQVFMGTQKRNKQENEESMMWTHFMAVQWQITHFNFGEFM